MSRNNINPGETLEEMLQIFYLNKIEVDSYKKIVDAYNKKIKSVMLELGEDEVVINGLKAKRTVAVTDKFDETKLLAVLKKHGINVAIKTKEYVDMDALEDYLYKTPIELSVAEDINKCKESSEVVRLTVTRVTEEK